MATIAASLVLTTDGPVPDAVVTHEGGVITAIEPARPGTTVPERVLAPGFVDMQVNGVLDVDVAAASEPAHWRRLDQLLVDQGTTTWCPTLVTASLDSYPRRLEWVRNAMAAGGRTTVAGVHLEGPFLGAARGAHRAELIIPPDLEFLAALPTWVTVVTLAPEAPGALTAIRLLSGRGVLVSMGHSACTVEEAEAGAAAGARLVTHLFNGMAPLHHRQPGLVGAALTDRRITPSLIADLVHVHPTALAAAVAARGPGGYALVTDSVAWAAETVGPVRIAVRDGAPRLEDGTLAGSALTMDAAVRNMVNAAGVPLADAVAAASTTPARLLGLNDRGAIAVGKRADLVCLTPELAVEDVVTARPAA